MKKELGILSLGVMMGASVAVIYKYIKNRNINTKSNNVNVEERLRSYYDLTNRWILLKNEGKKLSEYFINNNYKNIAIYGMGELGLRLYEELNDTSIHVMYGIDYSSGRKVSDLPVYYLKELNNVNDVEAIVVTPVFDYDNIRDSLINITNKPIISLNDVIFSL